MDRGLPAATASTVQPSTAATSSVKVVSLFLIALLRFIESNPTLAFSCGARSAFNLKERSYLRSMLSRRQLQGFVGRRD